MNNPLAEDLNGILARTPRLWEPLRGQRVFITGGTGFFGRWILESLLWADMQLKLDVCAVVLSRDPAAARRRLGPVARHPAVALHRGDVRTFAFPRGHFGFVIHAATEADARLNEAHPLRMLDTIVAGTRRVLDFSVHTGAQRLLFTSAGAVYGNPPAHPARVPETYRGRPHVTDVRSAYGQGKRLAERLCEAYHQAHGLETTIARGFAFVGPHLPLNRHFAIGNFIRDGLRGGPILVAGDGTPCRSYQYAADLAEWLWTILLCGAPARPYNVGSEDGHSIAAVARLTADVFARITGRRPEVQIRRKPQPGVAAQRYVPDTSRARRELGLRNHVPLCAAIARTIFWAQRAKEIELS